VSVFNRPIAAILTVFILLGSIATSLADSDKLGAIRSTVRAVRSYRYQPEPTGNTIEEIRASRVANCLDRSRVLTRDLLDKGLDPADIRLVVGRHGRMDHAWVEILYRQAWQILETTAKPNARTMLSRFRHPEYKQITVLPLP